MNIPEENLNPDSKMSTLKTADIELRQTTLVCSVCRTNTMNAYGALQKNGKRIKRFVKVDGGMKTLHHGVVCNACSDGIQERPVTERCHQCGAPIDGDWQKRMSHVAEKEGAKLRFCSKVCEKAFDLFATLQNDTIEAWQVQHPKPRHSPVIRMEEKPDDEILLTLIHHLDSRLAQHLATELARAATTAAWAISHHIQGGWYPVLKTNTINLTDNIAIMLPLPLAAIPAIQKTKG